MINDDFSMLFFPWALKKYFVKVQCKIELFQFEIYSITIKEGKMSITLAEVAQFQHLLKIGLQLNGIFVSSYILY